MTNNHRPCCRVRRWSASAGLAAVAAAKIGAAGAPAANADDGSLATDIGLLSTAQADLTDTLNVLGGSQAVPDIFGQIEAIQTPLLSSDNSLISGLGEILFNGPDQQLAQASDTLLSAANTFTASPTATDGLDLISAGFGFDGSLLFGNLPADVFGKLTEQVLGLGSAAGGAATDVATSASVPDITPTDLLDEAAVNFTSADQVLASIPSVDSDTFLASQPGLQNLAEDALTHLGAAEGALSSYDNGALTDLLNPWFTEVNQGWLQASEAVLNGDQAVETAISTASGVQAAEFADYAASFGIVSSEFNSLPIEFLSILTPAATDVATGLDPASAIDPGIFADLPSSIGL
jgi:hypothetical protein